MLLQHFLENQKIEANDDSLYSRCFFNEPNDNIKANSFINKFRTLKPQLKNYSCILLISNNRESIYEKNIERLLKNQIIWP